MQRPRPADLVLLGVAVAAVSTSAPLVRQAAAPALVIAAWRNVLAAAVLVPFTMARRRTEVAALGACERRRIALAGVLLAAHFATWIPSLSLTSVASSVALVATQPVWSALLDRRRGEQVNRGMWAGILVALAGVLVLSGVDLSVSSRALAGDALALVGGMLAAAYVATGASVRRSVSTTTYTTGCYAVAALVLLGACAVGGQDIVPADGRAWAAIAAITAGPQFLGHSIINRLLRTVPATVVSVAILAEVVGASLLAWAWFGVVPPAATVPAAALVLVGVGLVVRSTRPGTAAVPVD